MKTLGSLFDGSGGFPLAGKINGFKPVWASEIEPFPIKVTRKRFPEMEHLGNVKNIRGGVIEPVDVICGGSPCQNLSQAGNRTGIEGTQSSLFFEYIRIVKEMREATNGKYPRYMVWENVPGAFTSNKGADFKAVLENIARIKDPEATIPMPEKWEHAGTVVGDGFSISWRVLDAQFWGVPQRRRRIFLVAGFDDECTEEILFESEGMFRNLAANFRTWKEAAGSAGESTEETSRIVIENHPQDSRYKIVEKSETLSARMGTGGGNVPLTLNADAQNEPITLKMRSGCAGGGKGPLMTKNKVLTLTTLNDITLFDPVYITSNQNFHASVDANISPTLLASDHKDPPRVCYKDVVLNDQGGSSINVDEGVSPTLRANAHQHEPCVLDDSKTYEVPEDTTTYIVRRIMPEERCRLQGFPDGWCNDLEIEEPTEEDLAFWREIFDTWCEVNGKKKKTDKQIVKWLQTKCTDSAAYKMWGNGVALPCVDYVMCSLANRIDELDSQK